MKPYAPVIAYFVWLLFAVVLWTVRTDAQTKEPPGTADLSTPAPKDHYHPQGRPGVNGRNRLIPRQVYFGAELDPTTPASVTTKTLTLQFTPAPDTLLLVNYLSSRVGQSRSYIIPPASAAPRTVTVVLPKFRPFTTTDLVTVVYWTTEAPPVP